MSEKPILFSAPMVRAILAGDKTQTRRQVKYQRGDDCFVLQDYGDGWWPYSSTDGETANVDGMEYPYRCPYGTVGDRPYIRETFYAYGRWETRFSAKKKRDEWHFVDMTLECGHTYAYATDGAPHNFHKGNQRSDRTPSWWKRPAIHMPRAASRIVLEISGVRVERLQDISEADASAEGAMSWAQEQDAPIKDLNGGDDRIAFMALWESINGAGSWAANPWVWVVEFGRIRR